MWKVIGDSQDNGLLKRFAFPSARWEPTIWDLSNLNSQFEIFDHPHAVYLSILLVCGFNSQQFPLPSHSAPMFERVHFPFRPMIGAVISPIYFYIESVAICGSQMYREGEAIYQNFQYGWNFDFVSFFIHMRS